MKARFVSLSYLKNCQFVEIAEPGSRHKNVIGTTPSGTTIYVCKETRVMMILAAPGAKKIAVNIYPKLRELFPYRNVTERSIDTLKMMLYGVEFEVENGEVMDLEEKLQEAL